MSAKVTKVVAIEPPEGPAFSLVIYGDCIEIRHPDKESLFLTTDDFEIAAYAMGYIMAKEND